MGTSNIETWSERAKVSIALEGGSDITFEALTETIDVDLGDKAIETVKTTKGGRLVKYTPQDDSTITLEAYPVEAGTTTANKSSYNGTGFFDLLNTSATSQFQPIQISGDLNRDRVRCSILWTNDSTNINAAGGIIAGPKALRIVGCGFVTSAKPSFTDGVLKFSVSITVPSFKKDGTANIKMESTDGTQPLGGLSSFTASTNW
jgi:hypothetical protein